MQKQFQDHYYTLKEKSNGNIFSHNKNTKQDGERSLLEEKSQR